MDMAKTRSSKDIRAIDLGEGLILVSVGAAETGSRNARETLSRSEEEVARLAAQGLSNDAIAARRQCSTHTVANQLASAYRKLGVSGRRELRALLKQDGV